MNEIKQSLITGLSSTAYNSGSSPCFTDPVCGDYGISQSAIYALNADEQLRNKIGKVLATRKLRYGNPHVFICTSDLDGRLLNNEFKNVSIDNLLSGYPKDFPSTINEALINLSKLVEEPGGQIEIDAKIQWYLYAHNAMSLSYILEQMEDLEYIEFVDHGHRGAKIFRIKVLGWQHLQKMSASPKESKKAFVAMWFDSAMEPFYKEGIKPTLVSLGYQPIRIDEKPHNEKICDQIIAEIKKSRFVVADFTGNRGGVYFEAGYAQGLGIPVIWTVREEGINTVHFDTRQYNHIVYKDVEELKEKLTYRIEATIH